MVRLKCAKLSSRIGYTTIICSDVMKINCIDSDGRLWTRVDTTSGLYPSLQSGKVFGLYLKKKTFLVLTVYTTTTGVLAVVKLYQCENGCYLSRYNKESTPTTGLSAE